MTRVQLYGAQRAAVVAGPSSCRYAHAASIRELDAYVARMPLSNGGQLLVMRSTDFALSLGAGYNVDFKALQLPDISNPDVARMLREATSADTRQQLGGEARF